MSELKAESTEVFDRLLSEQSSYLDEVDQQIAKWTQFQDDYQHLQTRLSTLPDRLTYECTVPFGKLAFLPGRIIHSNEILVLLGDNYFVERSCKQAREIVQRRLENINETLDKHRKEKQLFSQQKQYTNDFRYDQTDFIEIKEDEQIIQPKANRRTKLTDDEIREERRRLQERALKLNENKTKHVHFEMEEADSDDDDDDDVPHEKMKKIFIHHTETDSKPIGDPSPALFAHPGAISKVEPKAFTGKMIERDVPSNVEPSLPPAKRVSKFRASRQ